MKTLRLTHEFVEFIPEVLDPSKIYISMEFATATHRCCCGCGRKVVTPFTPKDWSMTFDGETISLSPSIGNKKFPCRSHYFIRNGRVVEAPWWDDEPTPKQPEKPDDNDAPAKIEADLFLRIWRKLFAK